MTENPTVKLSNELSRSNLKTLGFYVNFDSKDYEIICQDKYYKYASKKVVLCVCKDFSKVYGIICTKDYNNNDVCVSTDNV